MRAVRGAEGVVHVHVALRGKLTHEGFVVLLFLVMKAQVFEQDQLTGAQIADHLLGGVPDAIIGQENVLPEQLAQAERGGLQTEGGVVFALRSPEMGAEDHARAGGDRFLDRRQRSDDALVVRDRSRLVQRHVEIDANEHALIVEPKVVNRADAVETAQSGGNLASSHMWVKARRAQYRHLLLQRRPPISGFGFVFAALRYSRTR